MLTISKRFYNAAWRSLEPPNNPRSFWGLVNALPQTANIAVWVFTEEDNTQSYIPVSGIDGGPWSHIRDELEGFE